MRWTDYAADNYGDKTKLELLSDFLVRELERHVRFGLSPEAVPSTSFAKPISSNLRSNVRTEVSVHVANSSNEKTKRPYCKTAHNIRDCTDFKSLSLDDKWRCLRDNKVCYRCLKSAPHTWNSCKAKLCGVDGCTRRHHALLHGEASSTQPRIEEVVGLSRSHQHNKLLPHTVLKVVPVTVSGPSGSYDTYALLDDGSTATLIDSKVAESIGATGPPDSIKISAIGGMTKTSNISYVSFDIKGKYTHDTYRIDNARSINSLNLHKQTIEHSDLSNYNHLSDLVDMVTYIEAEPTILIGAEDWHLSITREVRKGLKSEPVACLTSLGWTLYGSVGKRTKSHTFVNNIVCYDLNIDNDNQQLDTILKEQYRLDSIGISNKDYMNNPDDQRAVSILDKTTERLPSGRFMVGLPWRCQTTTVPDSYFQAESRFRSLEIRMAKDSVFAASYCAFMNNMLSKGYAEEVPTDLYYSRDNLEPVDTTLHSPRWYLPHFGVYHPQKKKLRVVHDAAAKTHSVSLNSMLLPGPDLLQTLIGILFRFREGRVAMTADIKEMFPQIQIRPQDRDALRYLWRSSPEQQVKEYRMTSVIFGACSSPFIALYIKNKNAKEHSNLYPKAADAIIYDHYMDDYIGSLDDIQEAANIATDIITVHKAACFEMRGWISNDPKALDLIPTDLHGETSAVSLGDPIRALGVIWYPKEDLLGFRSGVDDDSLTNNNNLLTKRKCLSQLMRIFDPLGLLEPIVIKGRILFQSLWRNNVGWDDTLPQDDTKRWHDWFAELKCVTNIRIPRCYVSTDIIKRDLHVFSDASELAYACVAYWRFTASDGSIKLGLIGSKSRVTPLKPVSIPRLELQAALIASRLAATIIESHRNKPTGIFYWSDSRTVLSWLRADARTFRPFVAHRIGEIIENTNPRDWRWIPTDLNIADDATRIRPLESSSRWFTGPSFLYKPEETWPIEPSTAISPVLTEVKTTPLCAVVGFTATSELLPSPILPNSQHFSDWTRLLRATARTHQAASIFRNLLESHAHSSQHCNASHRRNLSTQRSTNTSSLQPLTSKLVHTAEKHIMRRCQLDSFNVEIGCLLAHECLPKTSPLLKLSPTLGDDYVLRLAGRIRAAPSVDDVTKSPVLLDARHPVVRLLIQHYHKNMAHGNNETVVNEIRQRYWILRLRPTVKNIAKCCLLCRIRKNKPLSPPMADLPIERLDHHQKPFTHVGLDYFGPLEVSIGRRREKRYVALYTCLTVRALHLEVVNSLSADSAIMSLRRFIARRGYPATIHSDNGTAFVGANRELKTFFDSEVTDFVATKGIKWKFIPPTSPFFGGCWERLVRSVKTNLKVVLRQKAPKEETFITFLMEVEAIVNSRPLCHVSVDPEAPEALTPFHFLIGQSSTIALPTPALTDVALAGRSEWQKSARLADHFWSRWMREVLPLLHVRSTTGTSTTSTVDVGEVVVIVDDTLPRGVWPKGRVTHVYPGADGIVRVVDVAAKGGSLRRPVKKLIKF